MSKVRDKEYLEWIRSLKCCICNHRATTSLHIIRITDEGYEYCTIPHNVPHHVGDGIHSRRYSDHWVVPVCDWHIYSGRGSKNCHHNKVHKHIKHWDEILRPLAIRYWRHYETKYRTPE